VAICSVEEASTRAYAVEPIHENFKEVPATAEGNPPSSFRAFSRQYHWQEPYAVVPLARICPYRKRWFWMVVDRDGKRFLHCEMGSRGTETGLKLWTTIEDQPITHVMTDYWRPYEPFVPQALHTQSKAETYTVEGYNGLFRHFLARLRRKSKCCAIVKARLSC
jgi:insertion element IS1 protein InsB